MVCGSIGYGGVDKIRRMYAVLHQKGFDIVDHLVHKGMDYSDIGDFRDKKELSQQIVSHDLQFMEKADVIVVVADRPSYGTGIEMHIATRKILIIIIYRKVKVIVIFQTMKDSCLLEGKLI